MEPVTSPATVTETPAPAVGTQVDGSATVTAQPTQAVSSQPAFDADKYKEYESKAQMHERLTDWLNANPDLLRSIEDRAAGKTKLQAPSFGTQPQTPTEKAPPITQELSELRSAVEMVVNQKRIEDNEKEIGETIKTFPFLDRTKLDAAHQKAAKGLYEKLVFEGYDAPTARAMALDRMRNTPLKHLVYDHFQTELQEHLVKSKTSVGVLPQGVGSRGDAVRSGQASVAPAYFDGKANAFKASRQNTDRQMAIVQEVMRDAQLDMNDRRAVEQVWRSLETGDSKLLGG